MPDNRKKNNGKKGTSPIDPNFAHVQPQAVEIERVVLGALMVDSDAFSVVSELLKPETFYEPRHQKIYEAIRNMNMDERPVDIMTLNDELSKMGEIDKVGGVDYLMEISSQVASAAHVESHARILAEKYMIGTDVEKEGTRFDTNIKDTTQTVIGEQPDCSRQTA